MFSDHLSSSDKDNILFSKSYESFPKKFILKKEAVKGLYLSHLFLLIHLHQIVQDVSR